jgi:drug/metabolite transporter (DMT)-like permease
MSSNLWDSIKEFYTIRKKLKTTRDSLNNTCLFFAMILLAVVLEVSGDWFSKSWSIGNPDYFLALGILFYATGAFVLVHTFKLKLFVKSIPIFAISVSLVTIIMGVTYFHEHLEPTSILGILLGLAAIILLNHKDGRGKRK